MQKRPEARLDPVPRQRFGETVVDSYGWMQERERRSILNTNQLSKLLAKPQENDKSSKPGMGFEKTRKGPTVWIIPPLKEARCRPMKA